MQTAADICILGIGNPLRRDDGIAPRVCEALEGRQLPGVEVRTCHQLQPEMVDELSGFGDILLIDASVQEEPVLITTLDVGSLPSVGFTHQLDARRFAALFFRFAGGGTRMHVCTVSGSDFGYGLEPSPQGRLNADSAVARIVQWVEDRTATD